MVFMVFMYSVTPYMDWIGGKPGIAGLHPDLTAILIKPGC